MKTLINDVRPPHIENTLYVGIDLALKTNHVVIVDSMGNQLSSFPANNDLAGAKSLREQILLLVEQYKVTTVEIGMEATGLLWHHLHQFLLEEPILNKVCTVKVYTVNPVIIKGFKKSFKKLDKTDPIDAYIIAQRVRFGELEPTPLIDSVYEPLKRLTRFRYHLVSQLIHEKQYFLAHLFLKYSSWQKEKPFSDACGVTASEIITELDMDQLASMTIEELVSHIITVSKNTVADPKKAAELLKKIAASSYTVKTAMKEPLDVILTNTLENVRYFSGKVSAVDTVIEKEFNRCPNTLKSIPGIGPVFAAGITAEMGSATRFQSEKHVASLAGLTWRKNQSGESSAEETPGNHGNPYLRYYLVEGANSVRTHDEDFRKYYQKKYNEVRLHQHKRALVLTARKLVRLCFTLLRENRLYVPESVYLTRRK